MPMIRVLEYLDPLSRSPYAKWFDGLNAEAAAKAKGWIDDFGRRTIVPVAVISGVFKREYLVDAQDRGLTIYWSHKLGEMTGWMDEVRAAL